MADELIIDLSNYRDRVGQRVTPGTYRVLVEDTEFSKSNAGNDMIILYLRVVGGEHDGATLVDRLTQTEGALFRTVNFMQAIGLPTPRKRLKINRAKFKGASLDVEVDDGEPYRGTIKSEVRSYMKATGGGKKAAAEDLDTGDDEEVPVQDELPDTDDSVGDLDDVDLDHIEV